jgi:hypothetical protein
MRLDVTARTRDRCAFRGGNIEMPALHQVLNKGSSSLFAR